MNDEQLKELFEERAAIMQYDGGMSREEAEEAARFDVYGDYATIEEGEKEGSNRSVGHGST